jgi:hypothetical protein
VSGASSLRDSEPNLVRWTNMAYTRAGVLALSQPRQSPKLRPTAVARPRSADPLTAAQRLQNSNLAVRQFQTFAVAVCTSEECAHVLSLVERGRLNGNANEFKQ